MEDSARLLLSLSEHNSSCLRVTDVFPPYGTLQMWTRLNIRERCSKKA